MATLVNTDRLGYYLVGWRKFYNKTQALMYANENSFEVRWIFNDEIFSIIDWSIPIETPLMEIYKKRALQLREQYDYLVLYYSGGADSTMALHAFIDNDIILDEIIMTIPEITRPTLNDTDYSNKNYFGEIKYAAEAHLQKVHHKLHPSTKITFKDYSKTGLKLLENDNWFEDSPLCLSTSITGILRQITQEYDGHHIKIHDTGKTVGYILGVDKPLVYFDGTDYFCYFMDTSTYHYSAPVDFNIKSKDINNVRTEFFYWTPDMPEILIKQCQEIKKNCERNPWAKFMASQALKRHISEYRDILHPVIYPDYVCEKFQTEKPTTSLIRPMDDWFWQTANDRIKNNYLNTISYLKSQTNAKHMIKNDINYGISAHISKFYKL